MTHRVKSVKALDNFIIETTFINGDVKSYDIKNLFSYLPQFKVFENDIELFKSVKVDLGGYGIVWNDELDLDAHTIWEDGEFVRHEKVADIKEMIASQLIDARNKINMTQKELAEKTGIYQADISKIERGIGNPSVMTLKRLADGLEIELIIKFKDNE